MQAQYTCLTCGRVFPGDRPSRARKFCSQKCQWGVRHATPFAERFWSLVEKGDGCWLWKGYRHPQGYGMFPDGTNHQLRAHRVAFELTYGPVLPGMMICHHCDNPPCVRPDHLFCGSPSDNIQDARRKGRLNVPRGGREANSHAKLTEADVVTIRRLTDEGVEQKAIASRFGVTRTQIWRITSGRQWR